MEACEVTSGPLLESLTDSTGFPLTSLNWLTTHTVRGPTQSTGISNFWMDTLPKRPPSDDNSKGIHWSVNWQGASKEKHICISETFCDSHGSMDVPATLPSSRREIP